MKQMSLHNIAEACRGILKMKTSFPDTKIWEGTEITAAVLDSRKVTEGALFFATVGERVDGHGFIASVYEQGAACVVTQKTPEMVEIEHGIPADSWGAYILVEDSFLALKEIAEFYRTTLQIPVIGITGSVGKTSTKEFIAAVLSVKYKVLKTDGNFNNEVGLPLTLLRIREEHEVAVVEMGISDFGEMHRLSKMAKPDICVITNIGQCHLETLKSREGILKAKSEIFDYMSENGQICLNGDDDKLSEIKEVHGKKPYFYGISKGDMKTVYATEVTSRGLFGSDAVMHWKHGSNEEESMMPVHIPLPGNHMVSNGAAAACVGQLLELSEEQIAEGISKVTPVGGRSNLIAHKSYTLLDDCYNANPVSMKAAIDLLSLADTVKVAILGDMFELGENSEQMHREVGRYAAWSSLDLIILIGENAKFMYEAALDASNEQEYVNQQIFYYEKKETFLLELEKKEAWMFKENSTVLIKASNGMGFREIVEAAYWREA
ncbi:UDP-N-acetylmuramoyl-tripeptide--D-alanyl-D-alanine ligase [Lachnospiraceae bacterium OttesenSCG-928-D06]|nr:UDP-N-acetylmuramoyl-tripeptide--D-alanyl-D-alanine ligase [Lachnospiraceae bacterium OttesenSCG-928-D06]